MCSHSWYWFSHISVCHYIISNVCTLHGTSSVIFLFVITSYQMCTHYMVLVQSYFCLSLHHIKCVHTTWYWFSHISVCHYIISNVFTLHGTGSIIFLFVITSYQMCTHYMVLVQSYFCLSLHHIKCVHTTWYWFSHISVCHCIISNVFTLHGTGSVIFLFVITSYQMCSHYMVLVQSYFCLSLHHIKCVHTTWYWFSHISVCHYIISNVFTLHGTGSVIFLFVIASYQMCSHYMVLVQSYFCLSLHHIKCVHTTWYWFSHISVCHYIISNVYTLHGTGSVIFLFVITSYQMCSHYMVLVQSYFCLSLHHIKCVHTTWYWFSHISVCHYIISNVYTQHGTGSVIFLFVITSYQMCSHNMVLVQSYFCLSLHHIKCVHTTWYWFSHISVCHYIISNVFTLHGTGSVIFLFVITSYQMCSHYMVLVQSYFCLSLHHIKCVHTTWYWFSHISVCHCIISNVCTLHGTGSVIFLFVITSYQMCSHYMVLVQSYFCLSLHHIKCVHTTWYWFSHISVCNYIISNVFTLHGTGSVIFLFVITSYQMCSHYMVLVQSYFCL